MSGYDINRLVEQRGFREWAEIGMTSIYVSLNKLAKKELVRAELDTAKKGKGPTPKKYFLLPVGRTNLKQEVRNGIQALRLKDARFRLCISALSILSKKEQKTLFEERSIALNRRRHELEHTTYMAQGGETLPQNVRWLFQYSLDTLQMEINFANNVLKDLSLDK
ncbi:PadR family transcriptional regulator [Vibrio sp. S9_S30]|nr:PadR family transcriptional regulator [Vibrio sp. S9_S30]